jgi:hypothetical protein
MDTKYRTATKNPFETVYFWNRPKKILWNRPNKFLNVEIFGHIQKFLIVMSAKSLMMSANN